MTTRLILPAFFALLVAGFGIREGLSQDAPAEATSGEDIRRLNRLYAEFKCKCPKENWTRTLAGCFEPCVDPQKGLVRRLVAEGLSDEKIRLRMILDAGTEQVLARPSSLPNYIPYGRAGSKEASMTTRSWSGAPQTSSWMPASRLSWTG